jgi:hypothetical protein
VTGLGALLFLVFMGGAGGSLALLLTGHGMVFGGLMGLVLAGYLGLARNVWIVETRHA